MPWAARVVLGLRVRREGIRSVGDGAPVIVDSPVLGIVEVRRGFARPS